MRTLAVVSLVLLIFLAGCGGPKPGPEADLGVVAEIESKAQSDALPEFAPGLSTEIKIPDRPAYRIGVADKLWIKFLYYPGYNLEVIVRPDGVVTIPSLGEVRAEGMPPLELQDMIRTHYAQILSEPSVSVIVQTSASQLVFVLGEVMSPGSVNYGSSLTVLQAITEAGGVNREAKRNSLILMRKMPDGEFAGTKVNLEEILDNKAPDIDLMPRDVIYVPMTSIAKVDQFVSQFFAQIYPVLYFYISGYQIFDPEGTYFIGR